MSTPDWLEGYAKQQGWGDAPQPDPKDVAELQAYADTFAPKQPKSEDIADLQGTAAALDQPSPLVDNDKPPPGQEDSGGHWETDDDGSRNWYVPPGAPGNPRESGSGRAHVMLNGAIPDPEMKGVAQDIANETGRAKPDPLQLAAGASAYGRAVGGDQQALQKPLPPATQHFELPPVEITDDSKRRAPAEDEEAPAAPQGHWVNGQWVRTASPTALGMEGKLELNRGEHAADEADAARALSMQREAIYNKRSAELQAQADAARAEQARTAAAREKAEKDYDHAAQLSQAAKVDPDRFWANKSTGAHVMAVLGVALGAVGSSMTHTPNDALEMIKSAIEHDLEAQKVNAANAQKGTENAWQKLRAATGSAQQADNLYRVAALQTAQGQLDELNAGPQARAGIDAALKQAQDQQQARALQFRLQTEKYSPGYMVGGGAAGGAPTDDEKVVQLPHAVGGYQANTRLAFKSKDEAAEARERLTALGIVRRARDRIAQLEKENPLDIYRPGSQAHDDAEQIRLNAVTQVGHLGGVKKLPIFDAEKMNDALKPSMYNAAIGSGATHRMDTYLQNANDSVEESLNTTAPELVRRHLDVNQRGEVTPGHHYTGEDIERKPMPKGFHPKGGTQGGAGLSEAAPLTYKPEVRHVTETPGKGKKKGTSTVTSTEPEEDDE